MCEIGERNEGHVTCCKSFFHAGLRLSGDLFLYSKCVTHCELRMKRASDEIFSVFVLLLMKRKMMRALLIGRKKCGREGETHMFSFSIFLWPEEFFACVCFDMLTDSFLTALLLFIFC